MPRSLRILFPGAWYHAMNRGGSRRTIFDSANDRRDFLNVLAWASDQYDVELHAYCLMGNHYHLLLRTPHANLPDFMKHVDGVYTQRINRRLALDGPLFRGRYKALLVDRDEYLLQVSRYIHLNPVEAGIAPFAEGYPWSSCAAYVGLRPATDWLHTDTVLGFFGQENAPASYRRFIAQGVDANTKSMYCARRLPAVLGSDDFVARLRDEIPVRPCIPESAKFARGIPLEDIVRTAAEEFAVSVSDVVRVGGQDNAARDAAVWCSLRFSGVRQAEVAQHFGYRAASAVVATRLRFESRLQRDPTTGEAVERITAKLRAAGR